MATKKTEVEELVSEALAPSFAALTPSVISVAPPQKTIDDYAIAALQSVDWNQIGMGVDQAAKLCWSMAEAMVRNKP